MVQPVYLDSVKIYAQLAGVWTDMTVYLIRDVDAEWGMNGNGPLDLLAGTGTMDLTLDNQGANLIPGMPGALAGWEKGVGLRLVLTFEGAEYVRFKGTVEKIKPGNGLYGHLRVGVHVVDWLEYAAKHPVVNPGVLTNQRGDDVVRTVLGLMPIQPAATELDVGVSVFGTTFDTVTSHTKSYAEFGKVVFSEPGYIYLRKDRLYGETLVYESAHHRSGLRPLSVIEKAGAGSGFLLKEDGGYLLKEDGGKIILNETEEFFADNNMMNVETEYGERVINRFTVYANPRRVDASPQVLFQLDEPILIGSGQTIQFKGSYADPAGGLPINGQNMITPVITTDYLVNTAADGSGTNISSDLVVTASFGTEGFNHTLTNNSANAGWITKFDARGYGIYNYNPIEHAESDSDSIAELGTQPESLDQKYQTSLVQGSIYAATTVDEERTPRMILNKVIFNANRSGQLMMAFLNGDVGFLFRCANDAKGIDDLYYVQGVSFKIKSGGFIMYTWIVKKICSLVLGLSQIAVEFGGSTTKDAIDFGYVPHLVNMPKMTLSAWIKVTDATFNNRVIAGVFSDKSGYFLNVFNTSGVRQFLWYGKYINPNDTAEYRSASNAWMLDTWAHVVFELDVSSDPLAVPVLYVDGSSISFTLVGDAPASGELGDQAGNNFMIGNDKTATEDYIRAFPGLIKDVRVYDRILSAAEVTTLYNSGTPDAALVTDGMVFQAFCVRTKELASFVDQTLTESMKLLDNVQRVVGTPHGSPVGRTP